MTHQQQEGFNPSDSSPIDNPNGNPLIIVAPDCPLDSPRSRDYQDLIHLPNPNISSHYAREENGLTPEKGGAEHLVSPLSDLSDDTRELHKTTDSPVISYSEYKPGDVRWYRRKWKLFRLVKALIGISYIALTILSCILEILVAIVGIGLFVYHRERYAKGVILGCHPSTLVRLALASSICLVMASITGGVLVVSRTISLIRKYCTCGLSSSMKQPSADLKKSTTKLALTAISRIFFALRAVFLSLVVIFLAVTLLMLYIPKFNCATVASTLMTDLTYFMYMVLAVGVFSGILCLAIALVEAFVAFCCVPAVPEAKTISLSTKDFEPNNITVLQFGSNGTTILPNSDAPISSSA